MVLLDGFDPNFSLLQTSLAILNNSDLLFFTIRLNSLTCLKLFSGTFF